jgi:hypothetical protein
MRCFYVLSPMHAVVMTEERYMVNETLDLKCNKLDIQEKPSEPLMFCKRWKRW